MKIPEDIAGSLQDALYLATLDGYCPDVFLGGRQNKRPDNARELWGNSVELIYRCLACELLTLDVNWSSAMHISDPKSFANALAQHDPFDANDFAESGATYWLDPLLFSTEKTRALLAKHGVTDLGSDLCESWANAISEIFDKKGIPWGVRQIELN
jgi:hypothetical protein